MLRLLSKAYKLFFKKEEPEYSRFVKICPKGGCPGYLHDLIDYKLSRDLTPYYSTYSPCPTTYIKGPISGSIRINAQPDTSLYNSYAYITMWTENNSTGEEFVIYESCVYFCQGYVKLNNQSIYTFSECPEFDKLS